MKKNELKNAIELVKKQREYPKQMMDTFEQYNVPYLSSAYRLVVEISDTLLKRLEEEYENM